jgi:hypothetical protein
MKLGACRVSGEQEPEVGNERLINARQAKKGWAKRIDGEAVPRGRSISEPVHRRRIWRAGTAK